MPVHARIRTRRSPFRTWTLAPFLSLSACGGGGGADTGFSAPLRADGGGAVANGGGLNAGATGHLVYGSEEFGLYLYHDLVTGARTPVPDELRYDPHPVATGEAAEVGEGGGPNADGEVVIRGPDGAVTARFATPYEVFGATLSPDASTVAVYTENFPGGGLFGVDAIAFVERDGSMIYLIDECRDVLWLPDGRAMLACGEEILIDDAVRGDAPLRTVASFEGELPNWLVLDPSGTRVAFELRDPISRDDSAVARMNLDGSDLVRLTGASVLYHGERPTWSPDGQWIGFRRSVFRSTFVLEECALLMAARVDTAVEVVLDDIVFSGEPEGGVIMVRHDGEDGDDSGTPDGAACADTAPVWVP